MVSLGALQNEGNSYKFAKYIQNKYRQGVTTVLDWVSEVAYHYIEKEQVLKQDFNEIIHAKKYLKNTLPTTPYKDRIIKGFSIINGLLYKTKR